MKFYSFFSRTVYIWYNLDILKILIWPRFCKRRKILHLGWSGKRSNLQLAIMTVWENKHFLASYDDWLEKQTFANWL